jgi:hypothetical protein
MKNKIDNKLREKIYKQIVTSTEFFHIPEGKSTEELADRILSEIKHLILSEIKKVEPEKLDLKDRFYGKSEIDWGFEHAFNQAIDKYHKALEELLK